MQTANLPHGINTTYTSTNPTTLNEIATMFSVKHFLDLLGANNLKTNAINTYRVIPNKVIKVLFPCKCFNRIGKSNNLPWYKIQPGDVLSSIATIRLNDLVSCDKAGGSIPVC